MAAMATSFSSKPKALGNARSISLPSRSHPTTAKTEEELNKLKSWETNLAESSDAEVICSGFHALSELQRCVDSLLTLPDTIQALSRHEDYEKWADDLLENSVKTLDICGTTREIVLQFKESFWDLRSYMRTRTGDHAALSFQPSTLPRVTPSKTLVSPLRSISAPRTSLCPSIKATAVANEALMVDYSSMASVFPAEACETIGGDACNVEMYPEVKLNSAPRNNMPRTALERVEREYLEYNDPKTVFLGEACDDLGGEFCEPEYLRGVH
nr:light-regulated protein-like [Ipomoea batatas]